MISKILIITLLSLSSAFTAVSPIDTIQKDPFLNKITYSKKEIRLASNIKSAYRLSHKNIVNRKILLKIYKDIGRKKIFADFKPWAKALVKLDRLKSLSRLRSTCTKYSENKPTEKVEALLNQNLIDICFNRYLGLLSKHNKRNEMFHKSELRFIKFHTKNILKKFQHKELEFLLKRFKKDSKKHRLYTNVFFGHYKAYNEVPPASLIQVMSLLPKHTRYLQQKDLEKYNTQYVFYKEFRKIKEHAFTTVDTSKNQEEIRDAFDKTFNYFNLSLQYLPRDKAILTLQSLSKSYMRRGYFKSARKGFQKILSLKAEHYDNVIFDYMWSFILEGDYNSALKIAKDYKIENEWLERNPKTHFWLAKAYNELGNSKKAKTIYSSIIRDNPLSFYAILSSKLLGQEVGKSPSLIYKNLVNRYNNFKINKKLVSKFELKKILIWGKVHQLDFMKASLKKIENNGNKEYVEQNLTMASYLLSKHDEYLKSFQIIYKSLNRKLISLNSLNLNVLFPKPYFRQIKRNTRSFDPLIALSLIRQESGFNAFAKSHVGARGLMQLMPRTARQLKRRVRTRQLYNPALNIKLGTKFLGQLMNHYDENLVYSLAAYNAGKRRVDEWQSAYLNKESILENIENIPFTETRKYVKLIFRNMFFYKLLTKSNESDSKDLNQIFDIKLGFAK